MYIPKHFRMPADEIPNFVSAHPFGQLITPKIIGEHQTDIELQITHLPFVLAPSTQGQLRLFGHVAQANAHANLLDGTTSVAVFTGEHGYVSPKHYDGLKSVPTWNYGAVHITGKVYTKKEEGEAEAVLKVMIAAFEPDYAKQWDALPLAYRSAMLKSIVAFEFVAERVEGKAKFSQNRTETELAKLKKAYNFMPE